MAISAAKLMVEVESDTRDFEKGMKRADGRMDEFGKSTDKTGSRVEAMGGQFKSMVKGAIIGVGVEGMRRFATASFNAAASLNESINAVEVVFGDAAGTILNFSETAIDSIGVAEVKVNKSATVLGSSLQAAGLSAKEAATQTVGLTTRAADMASVFETDVQTALDAIQAAIRGEIDPIEKFGVSMDAASVEAYALENALHDGSGEMSNQAKVLARLGVIMDQTQRVAGDYQNTQDDAAVSTKRFGERIEEMQAELGQKLIPAVEKIVPVLEDDLLPAIVSVADGIEYLVSTVGPFVKWSTDFVKQMNAMKDSSGAFSDTFLNALGGFGEGVKALDLLTDAFGQLKQEQEAETVVQRVQKNAMDDYIRSLERGAQEAKETARATSELGQSADITEGEIEGLSGAMDRLIGREVSATEAALNFEGALFDLVEQTTETGTSLDIATEAGRENTSAVLAAIKATEGLIETSVEEAKTVDQARDAVAGHVGQLRETLEAAGFTESQIQDLITQYNLVPDQIVTGIFADHWDALRDIQELQREMRELNRAGFNVQVPGVSRSGGLVEGRHAGGPVMAQQTYLVGEKGPELFTPSQSGTIVPNHEVPVGLPSRQPPQDIKVKVVLEEGRGGGGAYGLPRAFIQMVRAGLIRIEGEV